MHKFDMPFFTSSKKFFSCLETFFTSSFVSNMLKYCPRTENTVQNNIIRRNYT